MAASSTRQEEVTPVSADQHGGVQPVSQDKVGVVEISQFDMHDDIDEAATVQARVLKTVREDARDMQRMGKNQQLVRNFRLLSMTSFTALATAAWEFGLFLITPTLLNGGLPALLWPLIYNFIAFAPIFLSVAEMASMAPTSGCHYHWVSEFAPDEYQQFLSYIVGWVSTLAWQAGNAASGLLVGTLVQVIIGIANPDYTAPAWHATLLTIGAVTVSYVGNVYGNKALPYWQNAVFAVHILAYFAVIIPIWVNGERATHSQVWFEFVDSAGWPVMFLTVMVGQISSVGGYVGLDTAAHMSEEIRNASRSLPLAMLTIYVVNFVINLSLSITLAYHLPDIFAALDDPSYYPSIYILRQVMSTGWLLALLAVTVTITLASNIVYMAAVSRDLFAFARDRGVPFSPFFAKVDQNRHIPVNACLASSAVSIGLSLIYLGSSVAFYAIAGLYTVALLGSYMASISCCLWRRVRHPDTMPRGQFSLGKWGVPCNAFSIVYGTWTFFWCFWPYGTPVDASNMNWAAPIFIATILFAIAYFFISGRHKYKGPVTTVEGRRNSSQRSAVRSKNDSSH